jgi:formylglycine-generating enzyme required for sulfatase activity
MTSKRIELVPAMILIPRGMFLMGNNEGPDNEKPIHPVWADAFWLGKWPVTNAEYRIFIEDSGAVEPPFWNDEPFYHPAKPVVGVNWYEALAYCEWLSRRTGDRFRLPTEAEWERAARGGIEGANFPWGNESPSEMPFEGHDAAKGGPQQVGCAELNGFGLCDMSGSVHEWCSDFYDPGYYGKSTERNPKGPPSGERRVSRGGSWRHRVKFSRCAARSSLNPAFKYADYGFRVARSA